MRFIFGLFFLFTISQNIFCKVEQSYWVNVQNFFGMNSPENARCKFIEKTIHNKQFETIYDLIKDEKYQEQRSCYLRGNCEKHPMDEFVQELQKNGLTVKTFVKEVLKEQGKRALEITKKDLGISDQSVENVEKELTKLENYQKKLSQQKISIYPDRDFLRRDNSLAITKMIEEICEQEQLKGSLKVTYDRKNNARIAAMGEAIKLTKRRTKTSSISIVKQPRDQVLLLGRKFFWLTRDQQKATLLHEIAGHGKKRDHAYRIIFSHLITVGEKKIEFSDLCLFAEYRADQRPAAQRLDHALLIENFLAGHAFHENNGELLVMMEELYGKPPSTHPDSIDRYYAVKVIRQLHQTMHRLKNNKVHGRYSEDQYLKYIVGYEFMWDRWCYEQNRSEQVEKYFHQWE